MFRPSLDGDGIETIAPSAGVYFDHDANGFAELTGWVGRDDGLLVWDRNGNGQIDSGQELFGNKTVLSTGGTAANGFLALNALDTNKDGRVNAGDLAYADLRVWRDFDADAKVGTAELFSLQELGIGVLNVAYKSQNVTDAQGNQILQVGSYVKSDGTSRSLVDVWFAVDQSSTVDTARVAVSAEIASLPDVMGFGNVRDLHQAMARDTSGQLQEMVKQFVAEIDATKRKELLDQIIYKWTGVDQYSPNSRGKYLSDARKLYAIEAFLGEGFFQPAAPTSDPFERAASLLLASYDKLANYVDAYLMAASHFKPLYDALLLEWDNAQQRQVLNVDTLVAHFAFFYFSNTNQPFHVMEQFTRNLKAQGGYGDSVLAALIAKGSLIGDDFYFRLATLGHSRFVGSGGNDRVQGDALDNVVLGGGGNDSLAGGEGHDVLDGGSGNDSLSGDQGADVYIFGKGSGQDTIYNQDQDAVGSNADTIMLGDGITTTDVTFTRSGGDTLMIGLTGGSDLLYVQDYFNNDGASQFVVENLKFADGTVWGVEAIKLKTLASTAGNDTLRGYASNDTINGGDGNDNIEGKAGDDVLDGGTGADTVRGNEGNDLIQGGAGDDTLYGDAGNDTLDGGGGDDTLTGGTGADVYVFGKGSGHDTVDNSDYEAVGTNADTIQLGVGISTTGVTLTRASDDLTINLNGSDDSLRVRSYFSADGASSSVVENLKFADGTVWDVATIKGKILTSTSANDTLTGYASNDKISGDDGNDVIDGQAGDDLLDGGSGADRLGGGEGNDTIKGGTGNDTLSGGNGNDSLQGSEGNDKLYADAGNDTLDGGSGNDYMDGGTGADTYLFGKGSGQDTVYNHDGDAVGTNADTILLATGIAPTGVKLSRTSDDLVISLNGSDDSLSVKSYFSADGTSSYVVENLKFADGSLWDVASVKSKVLTSTVGNDTLRGYATNDTIKAADGNDTVYGEAGDDVLDGGTGADNLLGGEGNDTVKGGTGDDKLSGDNGNDGLQGNEGNDTLSGNAGNDTLDGGSGNDTLSGGTGADVYTFGKGSGQDAINNWDGEAVGTNADTILLGAGIATSGVTLTRSNYTLVISLNGSDDSLSVQSYFSADGTSSYVVENLKFADGSLWDAASVKSKVLTSTVGNDTLTGYATNDTINAADGNDTVYGEAGDDVLDGGTGADNLQGGDGNDTVRGGTGNDTLSGGNGSDRLQGNEGNDRLSGEAGNDTLDGGSGNDRMSGGTGADTYVFGKGSGQDTIYNHDDEAVGTNSDTILLAAGIATTDVRLSRTSDDLIIRLNGSDDTMRVESYFSADGTSSYVVENLKFADGTAWDVTTIKSKALASTASNDTLKGYANNDTINADDGNDTLYGEAGDDVLDGGSGADRVQGGDGNDINKGGTGNDTLSGGNGNDSLQGDDGNDSLSGEAGNDTLDGGKGNDDLRGGTGADIYVFGQGSGQDTVYNSDYEAVGTNADTILFGTGITTTGVTLTRTSDDLIIRLNSSDDYLRVQGYFYSDGTSSNVVENLKFADGTVWNYANVKTNLSTVIPPANTTVYGTAANETLAGGLGNDGLYGQDGNDTLDGGAGNDNLDGGAGNDTYLFGKGSGQDSIKAYDSTVGKFDVIQLGAGVLTSNLVLGRESDTLVLSINGSTDTLRVNSYFNNDATGGYQIEQIKFGDGTIWDINAVKTKLLTGSIENDTLAGYASADILSGLAGDDSVSAKAGNDFLDGGAGEDRLYGEDGDDLLLGGTHNDRLDGGNGNDNLQGQDGDDTLDGGAGNDILDGGVGSDTLDGGAGNDIYLFGKGSGLDTINASDRTIGKVDVIQMGAGLKGTDMVLKREDDTLVLSINSSTDILRVSNYFSNDATGGYQIEQIKFADGTIWDINTVKTKVLTATNENDTLSGYASADTLSGLAGDDTLNAKAGDDTLDGGAGEDRLYGEDGDDLLLGGTHNDRLEGGNGNDKLQGQDGDDSLYGNADADTLDGGIGNDTLDGGTGNDTYRFAVGSGVDRISDYDTTAGNTDVLAIGAGVGVSQLWFRRVDSALEVSIIGSTDKSTISNWYSGSAYQVEQFKTADGKTLLNSQVNALVSAMAAFAPPAASQTTLSSAYQTALNPVIAASWK